MWASPSLLLSSHYRYVISYLYKLISVSAPCIITRSSFGLLPIAFVRSKITTHFDQSSRQKKLPIHFTNLTFCPVS